VLSRRGRTGTDSPVDTQASRSALSSHSSGRGAYPADDGEDQNLIDEDGEYWGSPRGPGLATGTRSSVRALGVGHRLRASVLSALVIHEHCSVED